jgi:hypothetical protein
MSPRNEISSKVDSERIYLGNLEMANSQFSNLGRALLTIAIFSSLVACRAEDEAPVLKIPPLELDKAVGDLNGDGRPDRARVIQTRDDDDETLNRVLIVELGKEKGWSKILESRELIPSDVAGSYSSEVFPPGVTIEENRLRVHDGIAKQLVYKLENNSFVLDEFLDLYHSRSTGRFYVHEWHRDVSLAIREYDPPWEEEDAETPPAWCPWADRAGMNQVKCRYPQVPVVCEEEGKNARKLELMPTKIAAAVETPIVTSWIEVKGRSLRLYFRLESNRPTSFNPVVKNLKGKRLIAVSCEQRRDTKGMEVMLEFRPSHFGVEEDWRSIFQTEGEEEYSGGIQKTPISDKYFSALELPCVLEATGVTNQGTQWSVTSNPTKSRHAAPFVLMPAFVLKLPLKTTEE